MEESKAAAAAAAPKSLGARAPAARRAAAAPKAAGAPAARRAAAPKAPGPAAKAPPLSAAQREKAEKAALQEEEDEQEEPKNAYDVISLLLGSYKPWLEVKERTWRVGRIYACVAVCDLVARVSALCLFQVQYGTLRTASVSDTQALDYTAYGRPSDIETSALVRLTITVSAAFIRSMVIFFLMWKAFPHLRPSWTGKPKRRVKNIAEGVCRPSMRTFTYLFRMLLLLWCLFDILQACVPEDPSSDQFTHHRVFKLISQIALFLAHTILLRTLRHEREALTPFVFAGYFVMAMIVFTGLWLDYRIASRSWEYVRVMRASVSWTVLAEMESLMIFVGIAMPDNLTLSMGFYVGRTGKALPWEDDSFLNRAEPPEPAPEKTSAPSTPAPTAADPDASAPLSDTESDSSGPPVFRHGSASSEKGDQEVDF